MLSATFCQTAGIAIVSCWQREEFWLGADITSANGMKARGERPKSYAGEETYELTALMKERGLDAVRYRVWVIPALSGKTLLELDRREVFGPVEVGFRSAYRGPGEEVGDSEAAAAFVEICPGPKMVEAIQPAHPQSLYGNTDPQRPRSFGWLFGKRSRP